MTSNAIPTVGFVSLGCPKATVDSERILTRLRAEGYRIGSSYEGADLVIVNTCGFIDAAVAESLDAIGEALDENGRVVVTGCLGARAETITETHPEVLAVTGPDSLEAVMAAVHAHLPPSHDPFTDLVPAGGIKLTPRHFAYLKIAEGCNQRCSFCIIPSMRGPLVSRPIGGILDEAKALVGDGVRELLVVAQDTAAYGVDLKYRTEFWQGRPLKSRIEVLARELGKLGAWVRLHYVYPYPHVDRLVELMAEGAILPYLDIPLQHADRDILEAMRRPADAENMLRRIERWRELCPDIALRSTFIVGFPGETDAQFTTLLEFLEAARLDRAGAFVYSPVEGAEANALGTPVHPDEAEDRLERFMELQTAISADKLQDRVGRELEVLVDAHDAEGAIGRTRYDAPEIDGVVYIDAAQAPAVGEIVRVRIDGADEHDLYGRLVD